MLETIINIKPLSVNEVWQGKRFKTPKYKVYENQCFFLLPHSDIPKNCKLKLELTFGFSSEASDTDNPLKPILDILQKKYDFNDNKIYKIIMEKEIVKKGQEFIKIKVTKYEKPKDVD